MSGAPVREDDAREISARFLRRSIVLPEARITEPAARRARRAIGIDRSVMLRG
jgi:hypothetical protein